MANSRPIYFKIYKKKNVLALSSEALLLYLYILTNEQTSLTGCYKLSLALTWEQTRLSIEKIKECLKELEKQNLIEISDETDEIFIVDWGSYNWNVSSLIMDSVYKDARLIDDEKFRNRILSMKNGNADNSSPIIEKPQKTVNKQTEELFDKLWQLYPRKINKSKVTNQAKEEIAKIGYEKMKVCISHYKESIKDTEDKYVLGGDTFFNGRYKDYFDNVNVDRKSDADMERLKARFTAAYESIIKNFPADSMDGNEKNYLWSVVKDAGSTDNIINETDRIKLYLDEKGKQQISFKEFMEEWAKKKKV